FAAGRIRRGVRRYAACGSREARPKRVVSESASRRDQEFHRHRFALRGAGKSRNSIRHDASIARASGRCDHRAIAIARHVGRRVSESMVTAQLRDAAIALAKRAGAAIMTVYDGDVAVTTKSDSTPLTEADLRSHELIVAGLKALTP